VANAAEVSYRLFIGGEWLDTDQRLAVRSPYDGTVVAEVACGNRSHAETAIDAAERAMHLPLPAHWRVNESPSYRADHMPYGGINGRGEHTRRPCLCCFRAHGNGELLF
jgi:hypothetical protein